MSYRSNYKQPLREFVPRATYKGGRGQMVSAVLAGRPRRGVWGGIFFLLCMIGISTYLGVLVFKNKAGSSSGSTGNVTVKIEGPNQVKRGQEVTYLISYENGEDVGIDQATVSLFTSGNFTPIKAVPDASSASLKEWRMGTISHGKKGSIEVTGIFSKEALSQEFLDVTVQYQPQNFSSQFSAKAHMDVAVTGPSVEVKITGPQNVVAGQPVEYTIDYTNAGEPLDGAQLKVYVPEVLDNVHFDPAHNAGDPWNITLPQDGHGSFKIKGVVKDADKGGTGQDTLKVLINKDSASANVPIAEAVQAVVVVKPALNAVLSGTKNALTLSYENTGDIALHDVVLTVKVDQDQDVDSVTGDFGTKGLEGGVVYWDSNTYSGLKSLVPHAKGAINFTLIPAHNAKSTSFTLTPRASMKVDGINDPVVITGQQFIAR